MLMAKRRARLDGAKRLWEIRAARYPAGAPADATMNLAEGFEDAESAMVLNDLPLRGRMRR
jgi:hypothetical protein